MYFPLKNKSNTVAGIGVLGMDILRILLLFSMQQQQEEVPDRLILMFKHILSISYMFILCVRLFFLTTYLESFKRSGEETTRYNFLLLFFKKET